MPFTQADTSTVEVYYPVICTFYSLIYEPKPLCAHGQILCSSNVTVLVSEPDAVELRIGKHW